MQRRTFLRTGFLALGGSRRGLSLEASSRYEQLILSRHPVGYWRLGDASGAPALDATGAGRNGAYQGAVKYGQPGALRGDPNASVTLDGTGGCVEIADAPEFSPSTSGKGFTVEVWLRPDTLTFSGETADPHIHWLGKGEASRQEWSFRFYSSASGRPNRLSAYLWNPAGGLGSGAYFEDALQPGQWIHIVACFDPGDASDPKAGVSIFKNGVLRGGPGNQPGSLYKAYKIVPVHGTAPLRLGTRDRKNFLTGGLDEVAIYPRVLRPAEIMQHYRAVS